MTDFHSTRTIKSIRKARVCEQCGSRIEIGASTVYSAGMYEGDFYTQYSHTDCDAAALHYAKEFGCWGEDFPWFQHSDDRFHDGAWLKQNHPVVLARLGWNIPGDEEAA